LVIAGRQTLRRKEGEAMARRNLCAFFLSVAVMAAWPLAAQVSTTGEIVGIVRSDNGPALPRATVTVEGAALIQKSISVTTDPNGGFRFPQLLPGTYVLRVELVGYNPREYQVAVNVGRTSSVPVTLSAGGAAEAVTVSAEVAAVDPTSPKISVNFTADAIQKLPTDRTFSEVVETMAGVVNKAAFGAGGNVDGYHVFGVGAATNDYQLNGVNVSNTKFGDTYVSPNFDSIQEIQVVGAGASAEYANYTGAVVNIVTKAGSNVFHGAGTVYYTSDSLRGNNNVDHIKDLEQSKKKYDYDADFVLGGPLVKDRLTFFASVRNAKSENAPAFTNFYDRLERQGYQLRLDFLASPSHTLTAMFNSDPIRDYDLNYQEVLGDENGLNRTQDTKTGYLSWVAMWGEKTLTQVKYAAVKGDQKRLPIHMDAAQVADYRTGLTYNSAGIYRDEPEKREDTLATLTHYTDSFLGGQHEFKVGVEYEDATNSINQYATGITPATPNGVLFWITPFGDAAYITGLTNYYDRSAARIKRSAAFVQDKATFGRATWTVGLRYDNPRTYDDNTGKTIFNFTNWSPRLGLAYDLTGDAKNVLKAAIGRYYEKTPTYGPAAYAGTGTGTWTYYTLITTEPFDPHDWQGLIDLVIRPENFSNSFTSTSIPVEHGIKNPYSDIFNVSFERQLGARSSASVSYLYRKQKDFIVLTQYANNVTYEPFEYTSPETGRTFTLWSVTGGGPRDFALGNRDFQYQKNQMAILQFQSRPTDKFSIAGSLTWEWGIGTRENNECGVLSLCTNGIDTDPNYEQNPFFVNGQLQEVRTWQVKLQASYQFPWEMFGSVNFRWVSGRPWGLQNYGYAIPGANDPYYNTVYLEPKDARHQPSVTNLDLRIQKNFNLSGGLVASVILDVLNATNESIGVGTFFSTNVQDTYGKESTKEGKTVSSTGKASPYSVDSAPPRTLRVGVRLAF
jgi:outer membrane receptor protein involved in Fe transport